MEETLQQLKDRMRGYWKDFLSRECGLTTSQLSNKSQPCPICNDGTDRYRFDDKRGDGTWYCNYGHQGRQAGDGLSFLINHRGISAREAIERVKKYLGLSDKKKNGKQEDVSPVGGIDTFIFPAPTLNYKLGATITLLSQAKNKPITVEYQYFWEWKDPQGQRVGYIGRKKDKTLHQVLYTDRGWIQGTIGQNRPAFCSKLDKNQVLLVEGEKSADLCSKATQNYSVVTWVGGASNNTALNTDWSFLQGKEVFLFPDNDDVGIKKMGQIYDKIKGFCKATIILPEVTRPPKWDLGDLTKETFDFDDDVAELIKATQQLPKSEPFDRNAKIKRLIRPLGFLAGQCYVMHWHMEETKKVYVQEVKAVGSGGITKQELQFWADWEQWKDEYGVKPDMDDIIPDIVRACKDQGVYDERKIRGAGFWKDKDRLVFHAGTRLYVNQQLTSFADFETEFIYQSRPPVVSSEFDFNKQLSTAERKELLRIFTVANTANTSMMLYYIGWVVLAPLSGCLRWRPHQFMLGQRGSGKTSMFRFYRTLLGPFLEDIQDSPTEAAIRQRLICDARPVMFDESELKNKLADIEREKINGLKRASCSDSEGTIIRGSSSGRAQVFKPRFMMVEAGTTKPKGNEADISREVLIETLHESIPGFRADAPEFMQPYFDESYTFAKAFGEGGEGGLVGELADQAISDKFIATSFALLPTIMHNYRILKQKIAKRADGRAGDTYGLILAAAAAFIPEVGEIMENDDATINALLDNAIWATITQQKEDETTQTELLKFICEIPITIEDESARKFTSTIVGAINDYVENINSHHMDRKEHARQIAKGLGLYGIAVKLEERQWYVYIAGKNQLLANKLAGTSHYYNWNAVLKRLPLTLPNQSFYCIGQRSQKGIRLPFDTYFRYETEGGTQQTLPVNNSGDAEVEF